MKPADDELGPEHVRAVDSAETDQHWGELWAVAKEAVEAASTALRARFRARDLVVHEKGGAHGVVTDADLASDDIIHELILRRRPRDGYLSEEGTRRDGSSGITWVIDPLDSTANFVRGLPTWSVSIAAKFDEHVVAAAVAAPATSEVYGSYEGAALFAGDSVVELPHRSDTLDTALGIVGWDRRLGAERLGAVFGAMISRSGRIRSPGSPALGLTWVAAGYADFAYFELDFSEWDYAAGYFLCQNVGLRTRFDDLDGVKKVLVAPDSLFKDLEIIAFPS